MAQKLWKYLETEYGVRVAFSDTGWIFEWQDKRQSEGNFRIGVEAYKMGGRIDARKQLRNIAQLLDAINTLMAFSLHSDPVLRERVAEVKIETRRRLRQLEEA